MSNKAPAQTASRSKASSFVLYVLLAVMLAALAYDYGVARPAVEKAYALVDEKAAEYDNDPDKSLGREEVAELLGRPADDTFDNGTSTVDVYQWRSGLLFRNHDLYVSYKNVGGNDVFFRLEKFGFETEVPSGEAPIETSPPLDADTETGDEAQPKTSFDEIDENQDGMLTVDEFEDFSQADADGNGSVSKEEYEKFIDSKS